jgi:hypothetical protein
MQKAKRHRVYFQQGTSLSCSDRILEIHVPQSAFVYLSGCLSSLAQDEFFLMPSVGSSSEAFLFHICLPLRLFSTRLDVHQKKRCPQKHALTAEPHLYIPGTWILQCRSVTLR